MPGGLLDALHHVFALMQGELLLPQKTFPRKIPLGSNKA
jgi:hypothetical protein